MDTHFWRITGHVGMDQIFERIVPHDSLSDAAIRLLLQCLLAREIDINRLIDGLGQRGLDGRTPLDVTMEPGPPLYYRLGRAEFMFEATFMTERPSSLAPGYRPGLAA